MSRLNTISAVALVATTALAGCGASGPTHEERIEDLLDQASALDDRFWDSDPTPPSAMPTTGTARYEGVAAMEYDTAPGRYEEAAATAELTANFGTGRMSGKMTDWVGPDGHIGGKLVLSQSSITENLYDGRVTGQLTNRGIETDFDLDAFGVFLDPGAQGTSAIFGGAADSDNGYSGFAEGGLVAER